MVDSWNGGLQFFFQRLARLINKQKQTNKMSTIHYQQQAARLRALSLSPRPENNSVHWQQGCGRGSLCLLFFHWTRRLVAQPLSGSSEPIRMRKTELGAVTTCPTCSCWCSLLYHEVVVELLGLLWNSPVTWELSNGFSQSFSLLKTVMGTLEEKKTILEKK